jgi:nucleoside-diphosphate-sugar epimerase
VNILLLTNLKFIGYHLLNRLADRSHRISVYYEEGEPALLSGNIRYVNGNRRDRDRILEAFKDSEFDVILDLSAYETGDLEISIEAFKGRAGMYIYCSTVSVYDFDKIHCFPIKENSTLKSTDERTGNDIDYGRNKVLGEEILLSNRYFPVAIVRPTYIYGPRSSDYRIEFFMDRILDDRPIPVLPMGQQVAHFIHVSDLVDLFAAIMQKKRHGNDIYNAAGEETVSFSGIIRMCEELSGQKAILHVIGKEEMFHSLSLENFRRIKRKIYDHSCYFDISKARTELSWKPRVSMIEGLREVYEWRIDNRTVPDYSIDDILIKGLNGPLCKACGFVPG